ncbi:MAG TPA: aldehyde dehydrogenase family protein, partial [Leptospiraceae bacterium]|nr:aldehyde dehydrogenase family protein [Leptospiraceae bacterium]
IIDEDADMNDAVEKITWGKFMNNGQTCIAPDYALVHKKRHTEFLEKMQKTVQKFYGASESDRKASPHFARIISARHHARLQKMIEDSKKEGAKIEYGGIYDADDLYISPTLLSHVTLDMPIMKEEIFGPVLPVLAVDSIDHAVKVVQKMEKPLALYIFSRNRTNVHKVLKETSSGGTCINETLIHFLHPNLPFGGVNYSGAGNSHGFYGFRAFSHERAILRHIKHSPLKLLYPPYTEKVKKLASLVLRYF